MAKEEYCRCARVSQMIRKLKNFVIQKAISPVIWCFYSCTWMLQYISLLERLKYVIIGGGDAGSSIRQNQSRNWRGNMELTKKEIRKAVLAERRALDKETVALASQVVCRKVLDIGAYEEAEDVCLYMPIRNEIDAMLLAAPAKADGKRVWVPKVVEKGEKGEAGIIKFNAYTGEDDIVTGAYDIRESSSEEFLEPKDKTVIIMPGAVFTPWRDRIGYGGGFYDRFLGEHPQCRTIALCFDLQVVDDIPTEEFDRKPDYVVSETSIYR